MTRDPYKDPRYQAARRRILADHPDCAICGKPGADTLDHIQPLELGGTHDEWNLRPAHHRCNARLGAALANAKKARASENRKAHVFSRSEAFTPSPPLSLSLGEGKELVGRSEPRLESLRISDSSYGELVAEWSARHLKPLMPWQIHVADGLLQHLEGQLCHAEGLVSTARQQGKSVLLKALAGFWVTHMAALRGDPQTVLMVANKLDRSSAMFRDLAPVLEAMGGKAFWSYGREEIRMPDGSLLKIAAAVPNQHGASVDLLLVDELWSISPAVMFDALRPTMIARPNPLGAYFSTAGDESSTVMLKLRESAIAAIDEGRPAKLYFAEWSPPPGVGSGLEWLPWANPALGQTIRIEALQAAAEAPDRNAYLRAHLNQWVASAGSWLPPHLWNQHQTDEPTPAGGILAIDSSIDTSRYVGVRASRRADGRIQATVEFVVESEEQAWDEVGRVLSDPSVGLAVTPTLEIHVPPQFDRRTKTVGYAELLRYTSLVRSMIHEGKVVHSGETTLAEHVARAVLAKSNGQIVLSSQKSPGPIELARCLIWTVALASAPPNRPKPAMGTSSR